tara:strand:- start:702 stop:1403 length:702 start_codon:yes stop_codon:yes gene_type:complete
MQIGAIIFSRFSSTRLPGKALIDIDGRCLLGRVIDRARLIEGINNIIVSTSSETDDDGIVEFSKNEGVNVFRGDLEDVSKRALDTCDYFKLSKFARICGDRPFFDPKLVSDLIKTQQEFDLDVATTTFPSSFPPGMAAEVIKTEALRKAYMLMTKDEHREHVTKYFYEYPETFKIHNIQNPLMEEMEGLDLALDSKDDLTRIRWIASNLNKNEDDYDNIANIISLAHSWKERI